MKFGGTSVKDANAIKGILSIIKKLDKQVFIVVSALAGVTNQLVKITQSLQKQNLTDALEYLDEIFERHITLASELDIIAESAHFLNSKRNELTQLLSALDVLGELSPKSNDMILAQGEILSSYLIYLFFRKQSCKIEFIDPREIIKTDSAFGEANVNFKSTAKAIESAMKRLEKDTQLILTGGFAAGNQQGQTTVLGRGGSDYSASVIASVLKADKLEIWTDVSGILTSDPRVVPDSKIIRELSYEEASELAYFGAKVLHPKTIYPAVQKEIPVWVKNTFKPDINGTLIVSEIKSKKIIKAIAFRKNISVINISSNRMLGTYGFLSRVFEIFRNYETSVDIVTTSEVSISLTIDDDSRLAEIKKELGKFASVSIKKNQAIICAVGEGIRDTAGIAADFFGVLKGINISMVSVGASEVNISIIVAEKDLIQAVRLLHSKFFDKPDKNIFYSE